MIVQQYPECHMAGHCRNNTNGIIAIPLIDSIFNYMDGNEQVITYEINIDWTSQTHLWEV